MRLKLIAVIFVIISGALYSQENSDNLDESTYKITTEAENPQEGSSSGGNIGLRDYLSVLFILVLVIGALYFVLRILKKVGAGRIGLDNDEIKVLSTKVLKGTTALHLVEVGNQVFLIGATDSSVNAISEITDKESKDSIILNSTQDEGTGQSFIKLLTDKLKKTNSHSVDSEEASVSIKSQREKLDRF